MCDLLPELGALLLQFAQRGHRVLQILDVATGLDLLQAEILGRARCDCGPVLLRNPLPKRQRKRASTARDNAKRQFLTDRSSPTPGVPSVSWRLCQADLAGE